MESILKKQLKKLYQLDDSYTSWFYSDDINKDAMNGKWLENHTSYIYKVGVLIAMDSNKCDWAMIAIGTQRTDISEFEVIGIIHFRRGENDDMGRVMKRASNLIALMHPAFEDIL